MSQPNAKIVDLEARLAACRQERADLVYNLDHAESLSRERRQRIAELATAQQCQADELALARERIAELEESLTWIAGRLALGRTAGRSAADLLGIEEHARAVLKGASNDPA